MANKQHLAKLREGVEAWNKWRQAARGERPDLSGANLNKANLSDVDLRGADLSSAHLNGANFRGAELSRANLRNAGLSGANLDSTDLSNTDFTEARFGATKVAKVDLRDAKGLETAIHFGASTIGIDTIYKSHGKIPVEFLRGCRVPEGLISYIPALIGAMQPIEFYSAFISYSSEDEEFARRLQDRLRGDRVRVWFAPEDLKIGDKIELEIDEAIRSYDKLMVVMSAHSIESAWVEREVRKALKKEDDRGQLALFPIRLDDAVMDATQQWAYDLRRQRNIGDFRKWKEHDGVETAYKRLLRDLQAATAPKPQPCDAK